MNVSKVSTQPCDKSKPRIYFFPENIGILEQFFKRGTEPYREYRKLIPEVAKQLGVTIDKVSWSRYAGCSCPCSPGFVVSNGTLYRDVFVTVSA